MTDTTREAPERIYPYSWHQYEANHGAGGQTEYVRADVAEAEKAAAVSAAYERAADELRKVYPDGHILALTVKALLTDEANDALAAVKAQARREALARAIIETEIIPVHLPTAPRMAWESALDAVRQRIRALIGEAD